MNITLSPSRGAAVAWTALALLGASVATAADQADYAVTVRKAVRYLESRGQAEDGSFSHQLGPGISALVTTALLRSDRPASSPAVARGLDYLRTFVQDDGGVYQQGTFYRNYETSLALMCFQAANKNGRYDQIVARADKFLRRIQWDADEDIDASNVAYGGAGYGKHKRPDLSNTSFLVDALKSVDGPEDRAAIARALVFVSRCQNLETEHNTTAFGAKNPDGGFYYTPAAGGTSQAGTTPTGGLRSYGSMTYAGLKSMIYAGVDQDDPRVKAAVSWIKDHYTLAENPEMGQAGVYYYYHTFAKALDAMQLDVLVDKSGTRHNWRRELTVKLRDLQQPDGSWINPHDRWFEGDPNLVTAYALLALSYCRPSAAGVVHE